MGIGFGFDSSFQLFQLLFFVAFFAVLAIIVVQMVRGAVQWNKNNHSPRLTVPATMVTKRTQVSRHHHGGEMHHTHTSTSYYATFEVESGDRMEFHVSASEYGMLVEGDQGSLSFQGTRYLGFQRY